MLHAKLRAEGNSEPHVDGSSRLIGSSKSHGKRTKVRRNGNLHVIDKWRRNPRNFANIKRKTIYRRETIQSRETAVR